ncbi:MAG: FKBP-type peptidyl-prolyl cis-trans isomerase [Gemmatimonadetes bacterium]|nr:FKBP-type peptidyl-prolyl cis-trans isomerase [Gemmatimonadota bacterium]
MRTSSIVLFAPLLLLLGACGEGSAGGDAANPEGSVAGTGGEARVDPRSLPYAPELGINLARFQSLPSGLLYFDDLVGEGAEAASGKAVSVQYTGYHPDGTTFDSSVGREPIRVTIGKGEVIAGWDQGIPGMKVGGRRILVIPPHLAYGARGAGGGTIPPNAVLVFRLELIAVSDDAGGNAANPEGSAPAAASVDLRSLPLAPTLGIDLSRLLSLPSGLLYYDEVVGGGAEATSGRQVNVDYTGYAPSGMTFDTSVGRGPFNFTLGAGDVIVGWDQGVPGMRVGGRRILVIPSQLGYGAQGAAPTIPPNAVLIFRVELLSVN